MVKVLMEKAGKKIGFDEGTKKGDGVILYI